MIFWWASLLAKYFHNGKTSRVKILGVYHGYYEKKIRLQAKCKIPSLQIPANISLILKKTNNLLLVGGRVLPVKLNTARLKAGQSLFSVLNSSLQVSPLYRYLLSQYSFKFWLDKVRTDDWEIFTMRGRRIVLTSTFCHYYTRTGNNEI